MSDPVRRGADAFDHLAFAADREGGRKFGCHEDGGSTICLSGPVVACLWFGGCLVIG
jgi:hypothetical protein